MARAYRHKPTAQHRGVLLRYARQHARDANGALARLVLGVVDFERNQIGDAVGHLKAARQGLPSLRDYAAYYLGAALLESEKRSEGLAEFRAVYGARPLSPLRSKAVLLAAKGHQDAGEPAEAVRLLRAHLAALPSAEARFLLAASLEAAGEPAAAAAHYQYVYFEEPTSSRAGDAEAALDRLRSSLAGEYPPAMPHAMLGRAVRLMEAGRHKQAKREFESLTAELGGAEREIARVRVGAASYFARDNLAALRYLKSLEVSAPEAEAERLYYILAASRRLDNELEMQRSLEALAERAPHSRWRMEALVSAGNHYLLSNQFSRYEPLYRACFEVFPAEPEAAYCHWKFTWSAYLRGKPEAAELLRAHLARYPDSPNASSALYFLGRLAEFAGDQAAARTFFDRIELLYPNYYYAVLARQRLNHGGLAQIAPAPAAVAFLGVSAQTPPARSRDFAPSPATRLRLERARLLASAGFEDWAETELRFGARTDAQAHLLAVELAQASKQSGKHDQAIRYIKSLAPAYLSMPLDSAPTDFWRLAFPLPYRDHLEKYARANSLDPYLVAALIRQESEFNPKAVSRARAYGLTQILPSTGRALSRKLGIARFRTSMLHQPAVNLRMGTYYLQSMLQQLDGYQEAALASYNAGKSRAVAWLTWAPYREPAEFVETIPFTETRNYVQAVLRNADIYRRLYANGDSAVTSSHGVTARKNAGSAGASRKNTPAVP